MDEDRSSFGNENGAPETDSAQEGTIELVAGFRITSEIMKALASRIKDIAIKRLPVLIYGETGSGKELVARALHELGPRAGNPLVLVNCPDLTPTLAASELFGHARGSFTDAREKKKGLLEAAQGGTIFFDEIATLPMEIQPHLLRVLETNHIRAVGTNEYVRVDARIIAATNADLGALVRLGRFRRDLYYRLRVLTITVPPLRERWDDIVPLANYFLEEFAPRRTFLPEALTALHDHSWPGNVRELKNLAMCLGASSTRSPVSAAEVREAIDSTAGLEEAEYQPLVESPRASAPQPRQPEHLPPAEDSSKRETPGETLKRREREALKEFLLAHLEAHRWNRVRAAKAARLSYKAFLYKMDACGLGIDPPEDAPGLPDHFQTLESRRTPEFRTFLEGLANRFSGNNLAMARWLKVTPGIVDRWKVRIGLHVPQKSGQRKDRRQAETHD